MILSKAFPFPSWAEIYFVRVILRGLAYLTKPRAVLALSSSHWRVSGEFFGGGGYAN